MDQAMARFIEIMSWPRFWLRLCWSFGLAVLVFEMAARFAIDGWTDADSVTCLVIAIVSFLLTSKSPWRY